MDVVWAAETAASETGSGYWQLAMVLLGIGLLTIFGRWRKARAPQHIPTAKEFRERDREAHRYRDAADNAIVEMLEMSRTLNAQIDTKIRVLNRLVKDAEDKTAALQKMLTQAGFALDNGVPEQNVSCETAKQAGKSISGRSNRSDTGAFMSELHERIHLLHNQGKTAAEIAKATNLSTTEVRFVIDKLGKPD